MIRESEIQFNAREHERDPYPLRGEPLDIPITWGSPTIPRCPGCGQHVERDPLRSAGQDWHPSCYLQSRRAEREAPPLLTLVRSA